MHAVHAVAVVQAVQGEVQAVQVFVPELSQYPLTHPVQVVTEELQALQGEVQAVQVPPVEEYQYPLRQAVQAVEDVEVQVLHPAEQAVQELPLR